MNSSHFRANLKSIMPGYKWTVHNQTAPQTLVATGIQTSGFNRLSTLEVTRTDDGNHVRYRCRSAGFGKRSPWLYEVTRPTLAQALRVLQHHYEYTAGTYSAAAGALQSGRKVTGHD